MNRNIKNPESPGKDSSMKSSVGDPDPHVFGPPGSGSGSISQRYGSGSVSASVSFTFQTKIKFLRLKIICFWASYKKKI
jgi:hypothetical protein